MLQMAQEKEDSGVKAALQDYKSSVQSVEKDTAQIVYKEAYC